MVGVGLSQFQRGPIGAVKSLSRRLTTIDTLARGIAENMPKGLPTVIDVPIDEDRASATQIASGKTYGFSGSTPASHYISHYGLYGADWRSWTNNTSYIEFLSAINGNGTDPTSTTFENYSPITIRFSTNAPKFEVWALNDLGFRMKVNGKYLKAGMYGVAALNGDTVSGRYFLFDFTGTEYEGTDLKLVEILPNALFRFAGIRVQPTYTVAPWPHPAGLRAALHGDSKITTVVDSADHRTAKHGLIPHIATELTGIPDIWANNQGGCGFYADNGGTRSDFIEHAEVNFSDGKFDLVWECGSVNDYSHYTTEADLLAKVKEWADIVLAGNPDVLIILTGPLGNGNTQAYQGNSFIAAMERSKRAVAALYPRNCAYIETSGNATINDPWTFGTGKVGATTGDGNADLAVGTDGVHPSIFGHQYLGARLIAETAKVLPLLASRIRDGVIEGVNDADITT